MFETLLQLRQSSHPFSSGEMVGVAPNAERRGLEMEAAQADFR
jgi:hypothetical protein